MKQPPTQTQATRVSAKAPARSRPAPTHEPPGAVVEAARRRLNGGRPLPDDTRTRMERAFRRPFDQVRVHTDASAVAVAREHGAQAVTLGHRIAFGAGQYRPGTPSGDHLIAHELAHVVQQSGSGGEVTQGRAPHSSSVEAAEVQAEAAASRVTRGENAGVNPSGLAITTRERLMRRLVSEARSRPEVPGSAPAPREGSAPPPGGPSTTGIIEDLGRARPSRLNEAMRTARQDTAHSFEAMQRELADNPPQLDRPTGLPRQPPRAAEGELPEASAQVREVEATSGEQPLPPTTHEPSIGGLPQPPPGVIARVETAPEGPEAERAGRLALASIPIRDPAVLTRPAPPPTVATTGDADPALLAQQSAEQRAAVEGQRHQARAEAFQPHGEDDIHPDVPEERLVAHLPDRAAEREAGRELAPTPGDLPAELIDGFDKGAAEHWGLAVGRARGSETRAQVSRTTEERRARHAAASEVEALEADALRSQLAVRDACRDQVDGARRVWMAELDRAEDRYSRSETALMEHYGAKIEQARSEAEEEARSLLEEAERRAEQRRLEAEEEARRIREREQEGGGGFFGWARRRITSAIRAIGAAINAVFEALRSAVRWLIEQAKRAAAFVIELARRMIVGLIRACGQLLRAAVTVCLASYPEARRRALAAIDRSVEAATEQVNRIAESLKQGVQRVLDLVGAVLDGILATFQAAFNLVLDVLEFVVVFLLDVLRRLGYLVVAAWESPNHFMGQLYEELLGTDLTQPLPFECTGMHAERTPEPPPAPPVEPQVVYEPGEEALPFEIEVDEVANLDPEPEIVEELGLEDGEELLFGENNDPANSVAGIVAELSGPTPGEDADEIVREPPGDDIDELPGCPTTYEESERRLALLMGQDMAQASEHDTVPKEGDGQEIPEAYRFGPLTLGQRARYTFHQMWEGIRQWWNDNWPKVVAGLVAVLVAGVIVTILTKGAVLALLPFILPVLTVLLIGVSVVRIAAWLKDYLTHGWAGRIAESATALARATVIGVSELVFALLSAVTAGAFKVLQVAARGAMRGGAAVARGGAALAQRVGRMGRVGRGLQRGARTALDQGRLLMRGVGHHLGRGVRSVRELTERLWNRVRFRRFKMVRRGRRLQLWGYINPWVLLADGTVEWRDTPRGAGRPRVGDPAPGGGTIIGVRRVPGSRVQAIQDMDRAARASLTPQQILRLGRNAQNTVELRRAIPGPRPFPRFFQAHHLIPRELLNNPVIERFFRRIGFNIEDGARNGVLLPPTDELVQALQRSNPSAYAHWKDATRHLGSHTPYTLRVREALREQMVRHARRVEALGEDTANRLALQELTSYTSKLRSGLLKGLESLN